MHKDLGERIDLLPWRNNVTALETDTLEARELRLFDAAVAKGLVVSKAHSEKQNGRYVIADRSVKKTKSSRNAEFPYSFSLEEAEVYLAS
jgi:hypothetical protein